MSRTVIVPLEAMLPVFETRKSYTPVEPDCHGVTAWLLSIVRFTSPVTGTVSVSRLLSGFRSVGFTTTAEFVTDG